MRAALLLMFKKSNVLLGILFFYKIECFLHLYCFTLHLLGIIIHSLCPFIDYLPLCFSETEWALWWASAPLACRVLSLSYLDFPLGTTLLLQAILVGHPRCPSFSGQLYGPCNLNFKNETKIENDESYVRSLTASEKIAQPLEFLLPIFTHFPCFPA